MTGVVILVRLRFRFGLNVTVVAVGLLVDVIDWINQRRRKVCGRGGGG